MPARVKPEAARTWFISGAVQGVGYRWFAQKQARELGLRGWVRNEDDGRVQVYGVGTQDQLTRFAGHLHLGPRMAQVRGVEELEAAIQAVISFETR
jgi:acylphosphatase